MIEPKTTNNNQSTYPTVKGVHSPQIPFCLHEGASLRSTHLQPKFKGSVEEGSMSWSASLWNGTLVGVLSEFEQLARAVDVSLSTL